MRKIYWCFLVLLLALTTHQIYSQCTPTSITPYVQINGGTWQQTTTGSLAAGGSFILGPQPLTDYTWNWSGPNGFSATTREIAISNIQSSQAGNYVATYTNSCGAQSSQTFSITVTSAPTYYTIACAWKNQFQDGFLYDNGNSVAYGNLAITDKYFWILEDVGSGYQRLKNKATGNYLNIASGATYLKCTNVASGDYTGHWTIASCGNAYISFKNRSNNNYLNIENNAGHVDCNISNPPSGGDEWSAQWALVYAGGSGIPATGITLTPSSVSLKTGQGKMLNYILSPSTAISNVTWRSNNTAVATVSSIGYVKAVGAGSAIITGTAQNGSKSATLTVTVTAAGSGVVASKAVDFLNSIGAVTHLGQSDESVSSIVSEVQYIGIRCLRVGPWTEHVSDWIAINSQTHGVVKSVITCSSPGDDMLPTLLNNAKTMANAGALLALEGPNEPNNFAVTFQGLTSNNSTVMPMAKWQREFYRQAKADPVLKNYPVFHSSEAGGSEWDNVGLQFLTVPAGSGTLVAEGTQYADFANVHNYISRIDHIIDNMPWDNASPDEVTSFGADGIFAEYGRTWRDPYLYNGYTNSSDRASLPKVTTETGWRLNTGQITELQQAKLYLNMYLSQFKRGFAYTFIYMLKEGPNDDEIGYGFYDLNWNPRLSATYLHNLTTILADNGTMGTPGTVNYTIPSKPTTVHDLLLQKSNGNYELVVWNERVSGGNDVVVNFGSTYGTVKVYDPIIGTSPINTYTNKNFIKLSGLSDHPNVIEFNPNGIKSTSVSENDAITAAKDNKGSNVLLISYLQDNSVNIGVNLEDPYVLKVLSINGQEVRSFKGNTSQVFNVQKGGLSAGMYVIKVESQNATAIEKIMLY